MRPDRELTFMFTLHGRTCSILLGWGWGCSLFVIELCRSDAETCHCLHHSAVLSEPRISANGPGSLLTQGYWSIASAGVFNNDCALLCSKICVYMFLSLLVL